MKLLNFFEDCLRLPYKPNSQDNPEHEDQVEELLKKHGLNYVGQPNGTQRSPDFRIFYESREIDVVNRLSKESARVELKADMARERARERIQMEMYDDPYLNWSGHR